MEEWRSRVSKRMSGGSGNRRAGSSGSGLEERRSAGTSTSKEHGPWSYYIHTHAVQEADANELVHSRREESASNHQ